MLPPAGTYRAQQNGTVTIRLEESGALIAYIPSLLLNCNEPANFTYEHTHVLCKKDGTPMQKNIDAMKAVFNWPGLVDEASFEIPMPEEGAEVPQFYLADCYHDDSYTPEGAESPLIQFKAKWFNVVGGGRKAAMTPDERKAALAKFKAKFKALGATSAKPAATAAAKPAAATAPAKKAAVSGPPGRKTVAGQARTSTQEEVWTKLMENGETEEANGVTFYAGCDAVVEGSSDDPSQLTPVQWGAIADHLGV